MRRVIAVAAPILSVALLILSGILNAWAGKNVSDPLIWLPLSLACAAVGSLMVLRGAGRVLGPLFVFIGLQIPLVSALQAYAYAAIAHGLPVAAWAAWFFQASISLSLAFFLILQLFPTGRPLSSRWRLLVWLDRSRTARWRSPRRRRGGARVPRELPGRRTPAPTDHSEHRRGARELDGGANAILFGACAVEIVLRYRRSSGDERAQLKWFAAASVIAAVGFAIGTVTTRAARRWCSRC